MTDRETQAIEVNMTDRETQAIEVNMTDRETQAIEVTMTDRETQAIEVNMTDRETQAIEYLNKRLQSIIEYCEYNIGKCKVSIRLFTDVDYMIFLEVDNGIFAVIYNPENGNESSALYTLDYILNNPIKVCGDIESTLQYFKVLPKVTY